MNAFEILGLTPRLAITEEQVKDAFREAGKTAHPDAGGEQGAFPALHEAHAILSSPSRRLKHWLDLQSLTIESRGTLGPTLMDLFSIVGTTTQQAETLIRKRDEAKSVLVRAMMEGETQVCREAVEAAISQVSACINQECSVFPALDAAEELDMDEISRIARDLAFLEKWKANLRSCYSRLV